MNNRRGYECKCVADTGCYAPDQETPAIHYCPFHAAAPALVDACRTAWDVLERLPETSEIINAKFQLHDVLEQTEGRT